MVIEEQTDDKFGLIAETLKNIFDSYNESLSVFDDVLDNGAEAQA